MGLGGRRAGGSWKVTVGTMVPRKGGVGERGRGGDVGRRQKPLIFKASLGMGGAIAQSLFPKLVKRFCYTLVKS